jgi:monoamine oxidase
MGKTNFTKVEQALTDGINRIEREKLDAEAKAIQNPAAVPEAEAAAHLKEQRQKQRALKALLDWLWKYDKELFTKLAVEPSEAQRLIEVKEALSPDDWQKIVALFDRTHALKEELEKSEGLDSNDTLVEQQRQQHLTKRFNVDDRWLPLK